MNLIHLSTKKSLSLNDFQTLILTDGKQKVMFVFLGLSNVFISVPGTTQMLFDDNVNVLEGFILVFGILCLKNTQHKLSLLF